MDSFGHRTLQENNERRKTQLLHKFMCFQMPKKVRGLRSLNILSEKLPLSQELHYSEGAVSHNVVYHQQLSIARYQVSFYANNYFE